MSGQDPSIVAELAERVRGLEAALWPVDERGLPWPTGVETGDGEVRVAGPVWQGGEGWRVLAQATPDDAACVFLQDAYGQAAGDVYAMTPATALRLAAALVAAARRQTDELAQRRSPNNAAPMV